MSEQMGEAGRKFIEEKFDLETSAKNCINVIGLYLKDK